MRRKRQRGQAWNGKQPLDQRDRLFLLAHECINQREIGRLKRAMKCVLAFGLEFDGPTSFPDGIFISMLVGIE